MSTGYSKGVKDTGGSHTPVRCLTLEGWEKDFHPSPTRGVDPNQGIMDWWEVSSLVHHFPLSVTHQTGEVDTTTPLDDTDLVTTQGLRGDTTPRTGDVTRDLWGGQSVDVVETHDTEPPTGVFINLTLVIVVVVDLTTLDGFTLVRVVVGETSDRVDGSVVLDDRVHGSDVDQTPVYSSGRKKVGCRSHTLEITVGHSPT